MTENLYRVLSPPWPLEVIYVPVKSAFANSPRGEHKRQEHVPGKVRHDPRAGRRFSFSP